MSEPHLVTVEASDPCFDGHFPGNPLVPGVVILDLVHAALTRERGAPVRIVGVPDVKFLHPLRPGERMRIELKDVKADVIGFVCSTDSQRIAAGSLRISSTHAAADAGSKAMGG